MKTIELNVEKMKCEGCENQIKNVISKIDGVESVQANHTKNKVIIKASKEVNIEKIKKQIEELGFDVK